MSLLVRAVLYVLLFDGPGGTNGTCIAVQSIGNAFRKLKSGRLVYLDIPCGVDGYHTDKTVVYYYGDIKKDEQACPNFGSTKTLSGIRTK